MATYRTLCFARPFARSSRPVNAAMSVATVMVLHEQSRTYQSCRRRRESLGGVSNWHTPMESGVSQTYLARVGSHVCGVVDRKIGLGSHPETFSGVWPCQKLCPTMDSPPCG